MFETIECHQYKIRKEKEILEKDFEFLKQNCSLNKCLIENISYSDARKIIKEYEWLKSMPSYIKYIFGIYFIVDDVKYLGGTLIFSEEYTNNTDNWNKYGFNNKIILLSRGVCLWWTPKNTASFFISKTLKWLEKNTKYEVVTATVDPLAGEIGVIYQACNFHYFGLMSGNLKNGKELKRLKVIINGKKYSTRSIKKMVGSIKKEDILNKYPDAKFIYEYRKRRYFYFLKNKRKHYKNNIQHIKPYPKKEDLVVLFKNCNGIIYKITNKINGKIYIGQTYRDLKDRINEHKSDMLKKPYPLYKSMKKYGFHSFSFEILEICDNIIKLNEREIYYISLYKSNNKEIGYNIDLGGKNKLISDDTRNKMSSIRKGKKQNSEWVEKRIRMGEYHHCFGKKHSQEYKKMLSEKMKGENSYWFGKKRDNEKMRETKIEKYGKFVEEYDLDNGNVINTYRSIGEAVKLSGKTFQTISNQCNGKTKKILSKTGFRFKQN